MKKYFRKLAVDTLLKLLVSPVNIPKDMQSTQVALEEGFSVIEELIVQSRQLILLVVQGDNKITDLVMSYLENVVFLATMAHKLLEMKQRQANKEQSSQPYHPNSNSQ